MLHRISPRVGTLLAGAALCVFTPCSAAILRVAAGSPAPGADGATWRTAYASVGAALDKAAPGDEVWAARGVYRERITLREGVCLLGGFAGTEISADQRDIRANETVLDGDAAGTVVTASPGITRATVISGFTIRNGRLEARYQYGGGILCDGGSPIIEDCRIVHNYAAYGSGIAVHNRPANPVIRRCVLSHNAAASADCWLSSGGGLYVRDADAEARDCWFDGNKAGSGGAVEGRAANVLIVGNTFTGNEAINAPYTALALDYASGVVANNLIAYNLSGLSATVEGVNSTLMVRNNNAYGNANPTLGGWAAALYTHGNFSADPMLAEDGLHVLEGSPCVDAGNDADVAADAVDFDGAARRQGGHVDIGAVETPYTAPTRSYRIVRVSPDGDDGNDGSSWDSPMRSLSAALAAASFAPGGEVWAAAGEYYGNVTIGAQSALYGGFAGGETKREQRDPARNVSILNAPDGRYCVTFTVDAVPGSAVEDFVLRHSLAANAYANSAAVLVSGGSPTVRGNLVEASRGGVLCTGGAPLVERNLFIRNVDSPAVDYVSAAPIVRGNVITQNTGGAVHGLNGAATISGNTLAGNTGTAGGIDLEGCAGTSLANNIVAFNGAGVAAVRGAPAMRCNCVYGNTRFNYYGLPDPTGRDGNLSVEPRFADVRRANWHILPDSPCRNAGDPSAVPEGEVDIDGDARVLDGRVDIGADESNGREWPAVVAPVIRVSPQGNDGRTGASWAAAKRTIQAGVDAAAASGGEVWVRAGAYAEGITLPAGVEVYGGYSGRETARAQRNWRSNVTTIAPTDGGACLTVREGERVSVFDGFQLNTPAQAEHRYSPVATCANGSPTLRNLTVYGPMSASAGAPLVEDCTVIASTFAVSGSAGCLLEARRTVFQLGSFGIFVDGGRLNMLDCVMKGVTGAAVDALNAECNLVNNTIVGCGQGLIISGGVVRLANNLITGNRAGVIWTDSGGSNASVLLSHNDIVGNGVDYDGLPDATGRDGNIRANPLLAGLEYGDFHLQPNSPCVGAGDSSVVTAGETDAEGQPRVQREAVDIGALESDGSRRVPQYRVVRVRNGGDDANDGSSWARAKRTVSAALGVFAVAGGEVWVAAGVYPEAIAPGPFVHLRGGFSGREYFKVQRDWIRNETVLDGASRWSPVSLKYPFSGIDGFSVRNGAGGNVDIAGDASVEHCRISGGHAGVGGGIRVTGGSPVIRDNVIAGNSAISEGAGIAVYGMSGRSSIVNNTIVSNFAARASGRAGSGVWVDVTRHGTVGAPLLVNNVIVGNNVGIATGGGALPAELVCANDVYGNGFDYWNCPSLTGVNGNFSADPALVDIARGDVHPRAISPCIDAGSNAATFPGEVDLDGAKRIVGLRVDVGAVEYPTSRARR
ncbi:MAG TPA: choice-of-anchor Q domain-containing protein [Armatimonadota bacterium]